MSDKPRRACRKLARRLGCHIDIERRGFGRDTLLTYWVYGPTDVYSLYDHVDQGEVIDISRPDPCDGEHTAAGWEEVWDKLDTYRLDLFFHHLSVPSDDTWDIIWACVGEGRKLLEDWVGGQDDAGHILADWIEDEGMSRLAKIIRGALEDRNATD